MGRPRPSLTAKQRSQRWVDIDVERVGDYVYLICSDQEEELARLTMHMSRLDEYYEQARKENDADTR